MNTWTANQFSGGMNDWRHPGLLEAGTSPLLVNAEVTDGKAVAIRGPEETTYTSIEQTGHYGTRDRSVVKYADRYYWSNNTATSGGYYGGTPENYIGMPYPAYSGAGANVTVESDTAASGETGISGEYKYCVTFVNSNGWEGAPGSFEEYETALSLSSAVGKVTVTWSDARIAKAKVYRTISHGAEFYHIGDVSSSGGVFRDTTPDADAQLMNPLVTQYYYPPPDRGRYLCEYNGVFFLAVGAVLYFSVQGNPHAWPTTQFVTFDDDITGIVPEFQGVLVFTHNDVFRVVGAESEATVTKSDLPGNHGCVNYRSIAVLNNAPVWLSHDGICIWDGNSITIVSYGVIHAENLGVRYAVAAHDRYILFHTKGAIVFDRRNGDSFYKLDFTCDYAWYDGTADLVYLQSDDKIFLYGTGANLTMTMQTPLIGGADPSVKIFRELIIAANGDSTVELFVDGVKKAKVEIASGRRRMKLPPNAVGGAVQLKIENAGKILGVAVLYE